MTLGSGGAQSKLSQKKKKYNFYHNAHWEMGSRSSLMENRSELIGHLGNSSTYISGETSTHPEATGSRQQSPPKKEKDNL